MANKAFDSLGSRPTHWIAGAVKHPGAFTASAKRAGVSVHQLAEQKKHAKGTIGRRARLALEFEKMRH